MAHVRIGAVLRHLFYHKGKPQAFATLGVMLLIELSFLPLCMADSGPLPMQNRFPLHFQFLTPRPVSPAVSEEGAWNMNVALAYTSINFDHSHSQWSLLMDMELTTLDLYMSYGLTPRLELALEMPAVSMQDGFLDDFLETYHDTIGAGNYDREKRPKNSFAFDITKQGQVWVSGKSTGLAFTDSVLSIAYAWPEPCSSHNFRGKLVGRIKAPIGDSDSGLGSGRWDAGFYWAMGWLYKKWSFYLMPGYALISDPNTRGADVSARNSMSLFAGAAYRYKEDWQWIVQVNGYSSPVEETGISALDNGSLELGLGFRYQLRQRHGLVFSFGEDLARAGPDFTVYFGCIWSLPKTTF